MAGVTMDMLRAEWEALLQQRAAAENQVHAVNGAQQLIHHLMSKLAEQEKNQAVAERNGEMLAPPRLPDPAQPPAVTLPPSPVGAGVVR